MTVLEYAMAREAGRLIGEKEARELTDDEWELLRVLMPTIERIEREEAKQQ